jgi:hypothetical protein
MKKTHIGMRENEAKNGLRFYFVLAKVHFQQASHSDTPTRPDSAEMLSNLESIAPTFYERTCANIIAPNNLKPKI